MSDTDPAPPPAAAPPAGKPKRPDGPFVLEVPPGPTFWLCTCCKTRNTPNCDASHRALGGKFGPMPYRVQQKTKVIFCGCLRAKTMPFCDDTHKVK